MTVTDALNKVVATAREFGYTDAQIECFGYEIREMIYAMNEVTDESVEQLISEVF